MKIYQNGEELNLNQIHLTVFENSFQLLAENLPYIMEPNFSSIQELKGQNKEMLELAFQAELNENI